MAKFSPLEEAFLRAQKLRNRAIDKWDNKIQAIREEIVKNCRHAETRNYPWEHDDGYGRQSRNVGEQCVFCNKINYYPSLSQQWTSPT